MSSNPSTLIPSFSVCFGQFFFLFIDIPNDVQASLRHCNDVWKYNYSYFLKCFFIQKYIKIICFYFLKIIFNISTSKRSKNTKILLILNKKNQNFPK